MSKKVKTTKTIRGQGKEKKMEDNMKKETIRSGDYCKCGYCGHVGYMYGLITSTGRSAPWCTNCGKNNKLVKLKKKQMDAVLKYRVCDVQKVVRS